MNSEEVTREALKILANFKKTEDEPLKVSMRRMVEQVIPDSHPWVVKEVADDLFTEMDKLAERVHKKMKEGV